MTLRTLKLAAPVFIAVILFAGTADANVMIPFMCATWIAMVFALVPIIIVEAVVLGVGFGAPALTSALIAVSANIVSTFVGIPIATALYGRVVADRNAYFKPEPATLGAKLVAIVRRVPWLDGGQWGANGAPETDDGTDPSGLALEVEAWEGDDGDWDEYEELDLGSVIPFWMQGAAILVLLTVCFLASWIVETSVAFLWEDIRFNSNALRDGVFYANVVSYGILAAVIGTITIGGFCAEELGGSADNEFDETAVELLDPSCDGLSTDGMPPTGPDGSSAGNAAPLSEALPRAPDKKNAA